ncbi:MAG: PEGA domain-containing protein [Sandaracinaceae bacterium]
MTRVLAQVLMLWLLVVGPAFAQDAEPAASDASEEVDPTTEEARAFFDQGRALADAHRYAEATEAFTRSLSLIERPSTRFNLAVTLFAQGRHVETMAVLEAYLAQQDAEDSEDRLEAARMLSLARGRVAELAFEVLPVDATVILNGQPLGGSGTRRATVDAGVHVVRVERVGHAPVLLSVEAEPGQTVRRAVELVSTQVPSTVHVSSALPTAHIQIDGEPHGVGATTLTLEAGRHTVRVVAPEQAAFERVIEVGWGESHHVFAPGIAPSTSTDLVEEPALWGAIAAGVGALAVGVLVGVLVAEPQEPSGGSTGVVIVSQRAPIEVTLP